MSTTPFRAAALPHLLLLCGLSLGLLACGGSDDGDNVVIGDGGGVSNPAPDPGDGNGAPAPGPGDGAAVRTGAASDCFNPVLMTAGTRYRWHMQTQVEGHLVSMVQERQIEAGGSFAGASGLVVDHGTIVTSVDGAALMNQNAASYFQLSQSDAGPVVVDHGTKADSTMTAAGMNMKMQHESVHTPPTEKRDFTLQPGQGYQYSATVRTTTTIGSTQPVVDHSTETYQVTYHGQKEITVAAGAYSACHFVYATDDGPLDVYYAVGSGLPLVIASKVDDTVVRMEMQADSQVNGVPVGQYHRSVQ